MTTEPVTNGERAAYYLAKAKEALQSAEQSSDPKVKADFAQLAASWQALAAQIQKPPRGL
jgi:hypothetical protein